MLNKNSKYLKLLTEIEKTDFELVGSKAFNYVKLLDNKDILANKIIITSEAFDDYLISNSLVNSIVEILKTVTPFHHQSAVEASNRIVKLINNHPIPQFIFNEIYEGLKIISQNKSNSQFTLHFSNIIDKKYIPSKDLEFVEKDLNDFESIHKGILSMWSKIFSVEAIELRSNTYFKDAITVAIIATKQPRPEITGYSYYPSPTLKDKELSEISAMFGLNGLDKEVDSFSDTYFYNYNQSKIVQKNIVGQKYMYIVSNNSSSNEKRLKVEISPEWQKRQTIEDNRIEFISNVTKEFSEAINNPIKVSWAIEAGEFVVFDFDIVDLQESDMTELHLSQNLNTVEEVASKKRSDVDLSQIQSEIEQISKGKVFIDFDSKVKKVNLLNLKKTKVNFNDKVFVWEQSKKTNRNIYLNVSQINSSILSIMDQYDGAFIDGTEIVLSNDILPESILKNKSKLKELKESYSLDVSTTAKAFEPKSTIYQFSNFTNEEYNLLDIDTSAFQHTGDERFLEYPESLLTELYAVHSAKKSGADNIDISFPSVRNLRNLIELKKIISSVGFKRTKLTKFFVELSIPSLMSELLSMENDIIDGVVINYSSLMQLFVYRTNIRNVDHQTFKSLITNFISPLKIKNLQIVLRVDLFDDIAIENYSLIDPSIIIFDNPITEAQMLKIQ